MRFTKAQQEIMDFEGDEGVFLFEGRQQGATTALIHRMVNDAQEDGMKCNLLVRNGASICFALDELVNILTDGIDEVRKNGRSVTIFLKNKSTVKLMVYNDRESIQTIPHENYYIDWDGSPKFEDVYDSLFCYHRLIIVMTNANSLGWLVDHLSYVRFFSVFEAVDDIFMSLINENRAKHGYKELDRFEFIKAHYIMHSSTSYEGEYKQEFVKESKEV